MAEFAASDVGSWGRDAITHAEDGRLEAPTHPADWQTWVAATETRHWCLDDPLLDWFKLYGEAKGFESDDELSTYDEQLDFRAYLLRQSAGFEAAVMNQISDVESIIAVTDEQGARSLAAAERTWEAMTRGEPVIYQGVLRDPDRRLYGRPDLLIRSDALERLVPGIYGDDPAAMRPAPAFPDAPWHYRVVDIKFTTLHLAVNGLVTSQHLPYLVQVWIYNQALGRLQGYVPESSYLLGRGWICGSAECLERVGRVDHNEVVALRGQYPDELVTEATSWIRRVRSDGLNWDALPEPTNVNLYPNMKQEEDYPWHAAKRRVADEIHELTLIWGVGPRHRAKALAEGFKRWSDPGLRAAWFGMKGSRQERIVDAILDANRSIETPAIFPSYIVADQESWRQQAALEVFVDIETLPNIADDFEDLPTRSGGPVIFLIGCGHWSEGQWNYRAFCIGGLDPSAEARLIGSWIDYLRGLAKARGLRSVAEIRLFHWSAAEPTFLATANASAKVRHGDLGWPELSWYDLLSRVVRAEPVTVRGAFGFGLKEVVRAMHRQGLIRDPWSEGAALDGLAASMGGLSCAMEATRAGRPMADLPLMRQITAYNEADCRAVMDVLQYLRAHH